MDWSGTYGARWRMSRVDPGSWERCGELPGVLSMRVERDRSDSSPLLESAQVEVSIDALSAFEEGWYRLGVVAGGESHDVATLWFSESSREWAGGGSTAVLSGRSVLYPASVSVLRPGAHAAEGDDGAAWAAGMLSARMPAPVSSEGSFAIAEDYVFDIGSGALDAVWKVLSAAGWCIQVDGRGEVTVREMPRVPALELSGAGASQLLPGVSMTAAEVPNAYVAFDGEEVAEAVDEDPASPTSTASRGFRVEVADTSPSPRADESLQAYAERRLAEEAAGSREYSYAREYRPGVTVFDLVRGTLPRTGLSGSLRVRAQSLSFGAGVSVEESAVLEGDA